MTVYFMGKTLGPQSSWFLENLIVKCDPCMPSDPFTRRSGRFHHKVNAKVVVTGIEKAIQG